jgi:hypothetical protein
MAILMVAGLPRRFATTRWTLVRAGLGRGSVERPEDVDDELRYLLRVVGPQRA